MFDIGVKVKIADCNFYDADGEIIGETKCFWKVKVFNHKTMGDLWECQKEEIKIFHKRIEHRGECLEKGFSKKMRYGDFLGMFIPKVKSEHVRVKNV